MSAETVETVEPLVPARRTYSRSVEDIARENAKPAFEREMETVRSVGRHVYRNPDRVAARLSAAIVDNGMDGQGLARSLAERPEQFGDLRGKEGLFRENRERKAARHFSKALGNHVAAAAQTWQRRLEAERQSETWAREKCDVVEVPGLTRRSEALLTQLDRLAPADKPEFLERLSGTPEGQKALEEATEVVRAFARRFGGSDPRHLTEKTIRADPETVAAFDRIRKVTKIADRAERAALSHQHALKQSLSRGLGLGM